MGTKAFHCARAAARQMPHFMSSSFDSSLPGGDLRVTIAAFELGHKLLEDLKGPAAGAVADPLGGLGDFQPGC